MKAGAITVIAGLAVIVTVVALYLWPSSAGDRCPALMMTAEQIRTSETLTWESSFAVQDAASVRSECLLGELERLGATNIAEPFGSAARIVLMPFIGDDFRRLLALEEEVSAAQEEMNRRVELWMDAERNAAARE